MQRFRVDVDANATQIDVRSAAGNNAIYVQHAALDAVAVLALPGAAYEGSEARVDTNRIMVSRDYVAAGDARAWFEMSISTNGNILIEGKGGGKGVPLPGPAAVSKAKAKAKANAKARGGPY